MFWSRLWFNLPVNKTNRLLKLKNKRSRRAWRPNLLSSAAAPANFVTWLQLNPVQPATHETAKLTVAKVSAGGALSPRTKPKVSAWRVGRARQLCAGAALVWIWFLGNQIQTERHRSTTEAWPMAEFDLLYLKSFDSNWSL